MISTELLSKVLDINIIRMKPILENENTIAYLVYGNQKTINEVYSNHKTINIYELAHKCKEWALTKCYELHTHIAFENNEYSFCELKGLDTKDRKVFYDDTEPEAIFQACEYILNNREQHD